MSVRDELETAKAGALAGGRVLESMRGRSGDIRTKGSAIDFVSEADVASGVAVVRAIIERDPTARFVCEEAEVYDLLGIGAGVLGEGDVWVIDPLDGTTSFIHDYPTYSVSVALVRGFDPIAGAVYNAAAGEMNAAAVGLGATRDGKPIRATSAATIRDALVITGFPYDRGRPLDVQMAVLTAFLRAPVHGIRRDGSAAVDCCHVAGGRADGFWEYALKPWDMAAGALICREAGAIVTDIEGRAWSAASESILAANPLLHAEMLAVIQSATNATEPEL
jgi:myo-inositol-1(or 4)-monophosphatase